MICQECLKTTNNYNHNTKKYSMSEIAALPGDKIASIEEYEAGYNTFDDGDMVRAAVMSSMIAVSIDYINGKPTTSKVECVCSTRNLRKKNVALVNDIVTLKILNHLNGTIHATIEEPHLGVLFTKCRKCGGKVVQMRDAIKCTECAWIDERKLSANYGNTDFVKLRE